MRVFLPEIDFDALYFYILRVKLMCLMSMFCHRTHIADVKNVASMQRESANINLLWAIAKHMSECC